MVPPPEGQEWQVLIYGGLRAAAAAAGAKSAIIQTAAPTSTGTQDYTVSGFGDVKAYIVFASYAVTDGSEAAHAAGSYGCSDGTRSLAIASMSQDNVGTSVAYRLASDADVCYLMTTAGAADARASHSAFITDGIRLNWTDAPASAISLHIMLLGGADLQAYVGTDTHTEGVDATHDTTDPGFQPDAVLFFSAATAFDETSSASMAYNVLGGASYDGATLRQGIVGGLARNGVATSATGSFSYNDRVAISWSAPTTIHRYLEMTSMLASGFRTTLRTDGTSFAFGYLALESATATLDIRKVEIPTGTGNQSITGLGFTPSAALLAVTSVTTENSSIGFGGTAGSISFSFLDSSSEHCMSIRDRDGQATTDTGSRWDSQALFQSYGDGTTTFDAVFSAFISGGITLNYTTNGSPGADALLFTIG